MDYHGIDIVCPVCRSDLEWKQKDIILCAGCHREYPVLDDIPDLRIFPDPYIEIQADHEKGGRIAEKLQELSFSDLVRYYYSMTPAVPPELARRYARGVIAAQARAESTLQLWLKSSALSDTDNLRFLDLGCGTAPLLVAAAKRFQRLAGADISFRWLIVAKKRLQEHGLRIPLFCACAEALPFPDGSFDCVGSESAIDQVHDQSKTLFECNRVLKSPGHIFFSTPNRWSLGPDPQTGVPGGGWLPDGWTNAIVLRKGGLPPRRKLLSANDLRNMILRAGFSDVRLMLPEIPVEQRKHFGGGARVLMKLYQSGKNLPILRFFLFKFGPLFHATAIKGI